MPFTEIIITILAVSVSWLILPLVIPLGLLVGLVFLVWHGVPKFSWDTPEPSAESRQ